MESYNYAKLIFQHPDNYNLLINNCLQTVAKALSYGKCSGPYASSYQKAITLLLGMTIPNSASYAMWYFMDTFKVYDSWNWFLKLIRKPPYYYFYNSIYTENMYFYY